MNAPVPVPSPVASYEATGGSAWNRFPASCNQQHPHRVRPLVISRTAARRSHDFLLLSSIPRRRRLPLTGIVVSLLTFATACTGGEAAASQFLIVNLPASIALLVLAAVGCGLAGFGFGLVVALRFLRAADSAAAQYHRAQIARVLGASSTVHASVEEALSIVHRRTQELQRLVAMLQRGGAK